MKKLCVCLSLLFILCFAGCNGSINSSSDGWQEIQSITYYVNNSSKTVTSTYEWEYTEEEITQEEFCNATNISPEDLSHTSSGFLITYGDILSDKQKFFNELNSIKNLPQYSFFKTYEQNLGYGYVFYKRTYTKYTLFYIKIKFYDDGSFDLQYKNETIRIKATSYKITYFND